METKRDMGLTYFEIFILENIMENGAFALYFQKYSKQTLFFLLILYVFSK